ncbi:hypothetical protein ACFLWH_02485, partial [Chloroflexota bacterium]
MSPSLNKAIVTGAQMNIGGEKPKALTKQRKRGKSKMPFSDVREFIAKLEKEGEAQRIDEEIDWNL